MIAAVKRDDRVYVAISICDSSVDMSEGDLAHADNLPFWKVKGEKDCYVCTEDLRYSTDLLRYNDYVFKGITDGRSVAEKVLPKMKELLERFGLLVKGKEWYNQLLIIKEGRIFKISNFLCVSEVEDHVALGFAENIEGTIAATSELDPIESILTAFKSTMRATNRVLFPITVFDSKSKRRRVFY